MLFLQIENEIVQILQNEQINVITNIFLKTSDLIRRDEIVAVVPSFNTARLEKIQDTIDNLITLNYKIYLIAQNLASNEAVKNKFYQTIEKLLVAFNNMKTRNIIDSKITEITFEEFNEDTNAMIYSINLEIKTYHKEVKTWL
ncbi:MAG: hypothetical protein ACO2O6_00915 [Candidatus Hydrothermia bacterium]|jgi:hypothetical protein